MKRIIRFVYSEQILNRCKILQNLRQSKKFIGTSVKLLKNKLSIDILQFSKPFKQLKDVKKSSEYYLGALHKVRPQITVNNKFFKKDQSKSIA